jgi:hypothetical protein
MTLHQAECKQCLVTLGSTTLELTLFSRDVSLYRTDGGCGYTIVHNSFRVGLSMMSSRSA